MLPFTKRAEKDEEDAEKDEVVTKDDVVTSASAEASGSKRNLAPPSAPSSSPAPAASVRPFMQSVSDDELTKLMPTKTLGNSGAIAAIPSPRPAAGAPPPSRARGIPESAKSSPNRSGRFAALSDEEEDGRTVVRGAPKIVKRTKGREPAASQQMPTTISPAAVIKATLDSARAAKRGGDPLMPPLPADLLAESDDKIEVRPQPSSDRTKILQSNTGSVVPPPMPQGVQTAQLLQPQPVAHGTIPPGSARPMSAPPPAPNSHMHVAATLSATQSGGYVVPYNSPPSAPISVPQSMPAHFMVPQAPLSDGRIDPPATAVTARTRVKGRPATSWAVALLAFGVFVGLGTVAVMRGHPDGLLETSASFVDPSRASKGAAVAAAAEAHPTPPAAPAATEAATTVGVPPVAVPAAAAPAPAPQAHDPNAPPAAAPVGSASAAAAVAAAPVAAPAAHAAPAAPDKTEKTEKKPVAAAPVRPAAPVARPVRPAPPPAEEKEPVAAAPATAKPGKPGKPAPAAKGDPELEAEQRKALKALQDSQLESTF